MKIPVYLLSVLLTVFLVVGCQTDYTEEALQRAREYALENTRILPEIARNHIRYVTPKFQTAPIFSHFPMRLSEYAHIPRNIDFNPIKDPNLDTIAAQFVWTPPKLGYSIIVIGYSRKDLSYWTPLKVVLKHVIMKRFAYESARTGAIKYVTDNMLYLSRLERVRVRTSEAEVRETQFDLEYMFEDHFESAQDEWKGFLEELKKQRNLKQYSVVWPTDDPDKRIVITGFGSETGLEKWKPSCGMVIPVKQLDEYTVEITEKLPEEADGLNSSADSENLADPAEEERARLENPIEPMDSADTGRFIEPEKSSDSEKPAEPATAEPEKSSDSEKPAEPAKAAEPKNPSEAVKPAEPAKAAEPKKPVESAKTVESNKPVATGEGQP